jgi:ParB family transcriptional regulator, chromosome partitioning protein
MARRRLLIDESELRTLERPGAAPSAPIAHLAGEAAAEQGREIASLREAAAEAGRLKAAEAEGRVLADVPLDRIDHGFLARDRILPADDGARDGADEAELALRASILEHGQRMPVELVAFTPEQGRALPYGLISGWRRLRALKALHAETGDARFATARAIVRREASLAPAFVAMVEENEIRVGLSFYERGRIAALAARQGAFATADAAVDALFAAGSPARRSKIRSFLAIHEALDDVLVWPEALGERLGLKLAQALKRGEADRICEGLRAGASAYRSAEDEQARIQALIAGTRGTRKPSPGDRGCGPDPCRPEVIDLPSGIRIERRTFSAHTDLRLSGTGLDEARLAAAIEAAIEAVRRTLA